MKKKRDSKMYAKFGRKGGLKTFKKIGKKGMSERGKKGMEIRWGKKLSTVE